MIEQTVTSGQMADEGTLTEDGKYYIVDNVPVAGTVHLLKEWVDNLDPDDAPNAINQAIASRVGQHLKEDQGLEFPTSYVFDQTFQRSGTDIMRGLTERATGQRATTPEQDMWDAIYQETNFGAALGGIVGGAILAPENAIAPLISVPQKLGKVSNVLKKVFESKSYFREAVKKDTAIGLIFGGLAAERPEYGQDFASNVMWGGIGGFGFGLIRGGLGRNAMTEAAADEYSYNLARIGVPEVAARRIQEAQLDLFERAGGDVEKIRNATPEQLQDPEFIEALFENMDSEGVQAFDRFFGTIAEELGAAEQTLIKQGAKEIDPTAVAAEFQSNLERQQAETAAFQRRQYEQDFNTNLQRIQAENQQRLSNEFNERLQRNQIEAQFRANLRNQQADTRDFERSQVPQLQRQEYINAISERLRGTAGVGSRSDAQALVTGLRSQLRNLDASIERAKAGSTPRTPLPTLLERQGQVARRLDDAIKKLETAKTREQALKDLVALKRGDDIPELKARIDETLAKLEPMPRVDVPEVRPPEPPRNIRTVAERQAPPVTPVPFEGGVPVTPYQAVPQPEPTPPPSKFARAPLAQPTLQTPQSVIRSALGQYAQSRSGGAAQVNPLAMPSGAAEAATMNTRTKAAQALPSTTRTTSVDGERVPLDAGLSNAQRTRLNAIRSDSEVLRDVMSIDGFGTGKYDFDSMTRNADDVARAVEEGIDEGNYRSAAQWLAETMLTGDSVRLLTPAEKIFAARIRAVAENRLADYQQVQRQLMRDGSINARSVKILNDMQLDKELSEAMDEVANIITMTDIDARNTGQALASLRKANADYVRMREKLARGSFIDQLFYGVTC